MHCVDQAGSGRGASADEPSHLARFPLQVIGKAKAVQVLERPDRENPLCFKGYLFLAQALYDSDKITEEWFHCNTDDNGQDRGGKQACGSGEIGGDEVDGIREGQGRQANAAMTAAKASNICLASWGTMNGVTSRMICLQIWQRAVIIALDRRYSGFVRDGRGARARTE
jgi:hypothetical protein